MEDVLVARCWGDDVSDLRQLAGVLQLTTTLDEATIEKMCISENPKEFSTCMTMSVEGYIDMHTVVSLCSSYLTVGMVEVLIDGEWCLFTPSILNML